MQRFFRELRKPDGGLSCYGEAEVRHALELGAVDMLLISEGLRLKRIKINCATCGEMEITAPDEDHVQCPHCKSTTPEILEVKDFIDAFYDEADQVGTKVELLSVDSEEGDILLRAFGGLAAVLRYGIGGM